MGPQRPTHGAAEANTWARRGQHMGPQRPTHGAASPLQQTRTCQGAQCCAAWEQHRADDVDDANGNAVLFPIRGDKGGVRGRERCVLVVEAGHGGDVGGGVGLEGDALAPAGWVEAFEHCMSVKARAPLRPPHMPETVAPSRHTHAHTCTQQHAWLGGQGAGAKGTTAPTSHARSRSN